MPSTAMNMKIYKLIVAFLSISLLVPASRSQTGGTFDMTHNHVPGGGGGSSGTNSEGSFSITGSIGQGVAGTTSTLSTFAIRGGFWAFQDLAPTAARVSISGKVVTASGLPIPQVRVYLIDPNGHARIKLSNSFGNYTFDEIEVGHTYLIGASSSRFEFTERALALNEEMTNLDLIATP